MGLLRAILAKIAPRRAQQTLLDIRRQVAAYAQQEPGLQARVDQDRANLYVAPLELLEPAGGVAAMTWTVWAQAAPTLFPRADVVVLSAADGRTLVAAWDDIEATCGAFRAWRQDLQPPRFLAPA